MRPSRTIPRITTDASSRRSILPPLRTKPTLRPATSRPRKLSYREKQELDELPGRIEALETEQEQLYAAMADPRLYQENGSKVTQIQSRLDEVASTLEAAYERWEELDALPQ